MTSKDICKYLNISRATFFRLLKAGRIIGIKVGRQWRFRKTDLDRYLLGKYQYDEPRLYRKEVLDRFIAQPDKYNVRLEKAFGWLADASVKLPPLTPEQEAKTLIFKIIKLPDNSELILIMQYAFVHFIPYEERSHWIKYEIRESLPPMAQK